MYEKKINIKRYKFIKANKINEQISCLALESNPDSSENNELMIIYKNKRRVIDAVLGDYFSSSNTENLISLEKSNTNNQTYNHIDVTTTPIIWMFL